MIKLSTAQLWVHDQDEALDFYTKKLGMEVRADVTLPEMGNFRWLTVGPAGQPLGRSSSPPTTSTPITSSSRAEAWSSPSTRRSGRTGSTPASAIRPATASA